MVEKVLGSMGIQAIISVMLTGTCCFLWATGQVVPSDLIVLTGMVVAHWLGRKGAEAGFAAASPPPPPPVFVPEKTNV